MTPPATLHPRRGQTAREWVLACIDESDYANSVCDHAGWFASHPEVGVDVLHVCDPEDANARQLIDRSVRRLREEGVGPITSGAFAGSFVEAAIASDANIIVMGKRGADNSDKRNRLGANVDAAVRGCNKPICLAPKFFLPIHRALVFLDADLLHRTALDFVVSDFRLAALPMDVAVVAPPGEDADAKVEWARHRLAGAAADVFALAADGLDGAMAQYTASRAADLVILSRAVIAPDPEAQLLRIEEGGFWSTRTPVLIC